MEVLGGVNFVRAARSKVVPSNLMDRVGTAAIAVASGVAGAVPVVATSARVRGGSPDVLVGLGEIPLGAPVASDAVGVAVVLAISVPVGAVLVLAGSRDQVDGRNATAVGLSQVPVVFDNTTIEVGSVEVLGGQGVSGEPGATFALAHLDRAARGHVRVQSGVEGFVNTILLDSEGGVAVSGSGQASRCEEFEHK